MWSSHTWKPEPEILEIYFLSCWLYKTISRHRAESCQSPCWTMLVLFTWKRKTGVGCCIYQFSLSLFSPTTCLSQGMAEAHFWAQQVVLCCAWHQPKISSSYWCFFFSCRFCHCWCSNRFSDFLEKIFNGLFMGCLCGGLRIMEISCKFQQRNLEN